MKALEHASLNGVLAARLTKGHRTMNIQEKLNELEKILIQTNINFEKNVSLKKKTWLKHGGETNFWVQPNCKNQLKTILDFLHSKKMTFEIIGNSSNCYFTENYNPIITITTTKVTDFDIDQNTIRCGCGYNVIKLSKYCIQNGIAGYEGFIGLPGTVGGAAINNSGCYGSIISEVVKSVEFLKKDGTVVTLSNEQLEYEHRSSVIKKHKNGVILSVEFDASKKGNVKLMEEKAEKNKSHRKKHQESTYLNLGSIHSELKWGKRRWDLRYLVFQVFAKIANKIFSNNGRKISNYFLCLLYFKPSIYKNISDKNFNCFVWKSSNITDNDFFSYVNFCKKNTKKAELEIEIKNNQKC
ncbi:MAG: FAD-binding protein [Bacteroidales bacterium]|nr:FAD-binding protein [Bacteroidales bacterium]